MAGSIIVFRVDNNRQDAPVEVGAGCEVGSGDDGRAFAARRLRPGVQQTLPHGQQHAVEAHRVQAAREAALVVHLHRLTLNGRDNIQACQRTLGQW